MGVFLLFGRTKRPDLHGPSPPAFFAAFRWQLGARCSLDRCDNSQAAGGLGGEIHHQLDLLVAKGAHFLTVDD
jgi:hypothetical protein